jgi:hypothetical protein
MRLTDSGIALVESTDAATGQGHSVFQLNANELQR